jgi:hypothetical protein
VWGGRTRFDLPVGIRTSRLVRPTNRNERTPLCHQYLAAHFLALPCTTELIKQELGITTLPPLPFSRPYNTIRQKKFRMPVDHDSRTLPFQRNFDGQVRAHTHTKDFISISSARWDSHFGSDGHCRNEWPGREWTGACPFQSSTDPGDGNCQSPASACTATYNLAQRVENAGVGI